MSTVTVRPQRGAEFRSYSGNLVTETCYSCGILFAFPLEWKNNRLRDRETWYCPNGHGQVYSGPTEAERLRRELEETRATAQREKDGLLDQLNKTEKERRRIIARVEAGVCAHCNRTFQNLARHMETKHHAGGSGSLAALGVVTAVHKARGNARNGRNYDGSRRVYCRAYGIHVTKTARFWREVTCEDCRKAGGFLVEENRQ